MEQLIPGVTITPLKIIEGENGDILRVLRSGENENKILGEAYFSTVKQGAFKGWKKHTLMQLNIVVPVGAIEFYFVNESGAVIQKATIELSRNNYQLLTVEPGVWMGFKGINEGLNMLLNVASIPHDPAEAVNAPKEQFENLFT